MRRRATFHRVRAYAGSHRRAARCGRNRVPERARESRAGASTYASSAPRSTVSRSNANRMVPSKTAHFVERRLDAQMENAVVARRRCPSLVTFTTASICSPGRTVALPRRSIALRRGANAGFGVHRDAALHSARRVGRRGLPLERGACRQHAAVGERRCDDRFHAQRYRLAGVDLSEVKARAVLSGVRAPAVRRCSTRRAPRRALRGARSLRARARRRRFPRYARSRAARRARRGARSSRVRRSAPWRRRRTRARRRSSASPARARSRASLATRPARAPTICDSLASGLSMRIR